MYTAQKMNLSIKDFFSKCDQIRLVTFTEEILNGKLHFLCRAGNDFLSFAVDAYTERRRAILGRC